MLSKTSSLHASALVDYLLSKHKIDRRADAYRNHENLWVQECVDLVELADWLRDEDYNPWVDFWDVTALGRIVFECWGNPLAHGAGNVAWLCNHRSGAACITKDSPFYPLWTRFIEGKQSLLSWLSEDAGSEFQPAELLFHAEVLLDKHWRRQERRLARYRGDERLSADVPWFASNKLKAALKLPKKASGSQQQNKAFARDFLPLMLAARLVMHFYPQSPLLKALALQSHYSPKTNEEYELYFRRLLLKHQVSLKGSAFIRRNLVAFSAEEFLYLCDFAAPNDSELQQLAILFDALHDEDGSWDEYLDKSQYLEYFQRLFPAAFQHKDEGRYVIK
ncbi:hypothetical protein AAEH88_01025 [Shewanella algae]|uniref:hypothetical protein n=1 Tax=Shewanella algae TaxID=38313 RepID=UPI00313B694B